MNFNPELIAKLLTTIVGFYFGYRVLDVLQEKTTNKNEYNIKLDNVTVNVNYDTDETDEN